MWHTLKKRKDISENKLITPIQEDGHTHTLLSGLSEDQLPWSWQGFSILLRDILAQWTVADTGYRPFFFTAEGQDL